MDDKNIKLNVGKQLKKTISNWKRLGEKLKKEIACKILAETKYDFEQAIDVPQGGAAWYRRVAPAGIIKLDEMARYIDMIMTIKSLNSAATIALLSISKMRRLPLVDKLIDDGKSTVYFPMMATHRPCGSFSL